MPFGDSRDIDFSDVVRGPSTVRSVNDLDVFVSPGNPMKLDNTLGGEAHTLWIGGFPAATVFYGCFKKEVPSGREKESYGWCYHTAHTCVPHGEFRDLEELLDHVVGMMAEKIIASKVQ